MKNQLGRGNTGANDTSHTSYYMKHGKNKLWLNKRSVELTWGRDFIDFRSNVGLGMETM
jgi:hypothetical protein